MIEQIMPRGFRRRFNSSTRRIAFYRDFIKATQPDPDKNMPGFQKGTRLWVGPNNERVKLTLSRKISNITAGRDEIILTNIAAETQRQGHGTAALENFLFPLLKKHQIDFFCWARQEAGVKLFESLQLEFYGGADDFFYKDFSSKELKSPISKRPNPPKKQIS